MAEIIDLSAILGRERRPETRAPAAGSARTVAETLDAIRGAAAEALEALDAAAAPGVDDDAYIEACGRHSRAVTELLAEIAAAEANGLLPELAASFRRGAGA